MSTYKGTCSLAFCGGSRKAIQALRPSDFACAFGRAEARGGYGEAKAPLLQGVADCAWFDCGTLSVTQSSGSFNDEGFQEFNELGFAGREDLLVGIEEDEVVKLAGDAVEDGFDVEGNRTLLAFLHGRALRPFERQTVIAGLVAFEGDEENVTTSLFLVHARDHEIEGIAVLCRAR